MRILTKGLEPGHFEEGVLILVDKPLDWTSFDVVKKMRGTICRYLGIKKLKVGHSGTLDPLATGLLLIATGKYTKLLHELQGLDKSYTGTMLFGASTSTYDAEGEPIPGDDPSTYALEDVNALLPKFTGDIMQKPPLFSAIKIKGQTAYSIARRGKSVDIPERPVRVDRFEVSEAEKGWPEAYFEVDCGKGTYIRSLAHDLGQALGTGAYLTSLRRTSVGEFHVDDAWKLEDLVAILEA